MWIYANIGSTELQIGKSHLPQKKNYKISETEEITIQNALCSMVMERRIAVISICVQAKATNVWFRFNDFGILFFLYILFF